MIVWAGVFGALLGWIAAGFQFYGLFLGGFLGSGMGVWLQFIVRREVAGGVARAIADYRDSEARLRAVQAEAKEVSPVPPPPPTPKPEVAKVARTKAAEPEPAEAERPAAQARAASASVPITRAPAPPPEPTIFDKGFEAAKSWLFGGNTIVRGGLILLFIGLSFLASFAANAGLFPIELRLALVGVFGIALLVIGLRKREDRPSFGLALQGTGVAILYLTVFAAGKLYTLLPPVASFGLMILFCGLGCALALRQNSMLMAFASFAGGFAVPMLLGGDSRTPVPLFTYISILNVAILFIAWKRSWRPINLLGFAATFTMAAAWGFTRYGPEHYLVCQLFLAVSIAIYLATAVLYAHNTPGKLGNVADQTLLFGPAVVGFGLQAALVEPFQYGAAFSALAFAAVYTGLAVWTYKRRDSGMALLNDCLIAIGVGFVTLAVPLALDAQWTSAAWALQGAGAFWIGARQQRWMARAFGLALQGVAALIFLVTISPSVGGLPIFNDGVIRAALIAVPLMLTAWWMRGPLEHSGSALAKSYASIENGLRHAIYLAGFFFVCVAIGMEASREPAGGEALLSSPTLRSSALMLGIMVAMWASAWFGRAKSWAVAVWPSWLSLAATLLILLVIVGNGGHVLNWPNWLFLGAAVALHVDLLRRKDADQAHDGAGEAQPYFHWIHAAGVWLAAAVLADMLYHAIDLGALWETSWAGVIFLLSATLIVLGLTFWARKPAVRWPLVSHARAYFWIAAIPLVLLCYGGAFATALIAEGITDPLPYLPLLNPVDLSAGLALVTLGLWRKAIQGLDKRPAGSEFITGNGALVSGGILAFVIINAVWLRTTHHWLGVEWSPEALGGSATVQTGLSILWTLVAMGLMLFAHRRAERILWLVGAGLLGVVVVKLLLVDMSTSQTWEKAVAFVGVGVIMLAIGYFVPIPPGEEEPDKREEAKVT